MRFAVPNSRPKSPGGWVMIAALHKAFRNHHVSNSFRLVSAPQNHLGGSLMTRHINDFSNCVASGEFGSAARLGAVLGSAAAKAAPVTDLLSTA